MHMASPGTPPTESTLGGPEPRQDPIESIVTELAARIVERTKQPDAVLTCNDLLEIIGPGAHVLAIFVFSLLNLLPAPRATISSWR